MSSYLGFGFFEPLPTLQEDDELVPLSAILTLRRGSLREFEIWAVCRECCLALRSINKSSLDMFKRMCLTPDTLSFNAAGSVSFSDLDGVDKEYQPPEFYRDGNTFKGHIFSLARTLLESAAHDLPEGISVEIGPALLGLLTRMSLDDPQRRPTLEEVTVTCNKELGDDPGSSKSVCRTLSSIGRRKLSLDSQYEYSSDRRKSSFDDRLNTIKDDLPEEANNTIPKIRENGHESSSSSVKDNPSMPGTTKTLGKGASSSVSKADGRYSRKSDNEEKSMREPPSPAALNNLSQRAQDILKKLYSSNEQNSKEGGKTSGKNNSSGGTMLNVDSEHVPNITVSSAGSSPGLSPARSPALMRKHLMDAKKGPPEPNVISSRLEDLVALHPSREDSELGEQTDLRSTSPEVQQMRKILEQIPRTDDIRTGSSSPVRHPSLSGRRSCSPLRVGSPSGRRSCSPNRVSSPFRILSPVNHRTSPGLPEGRTQSPRLIPPRRDSTSPQKDESLRNLAKKGSLRRRLSQKQVERYVTRRRSSGFRTPEIINELDGENFEDLDFMLDDLWSDEEDCESPINVPIIKRSYSIAALVPSSTSDSAFQTSTGGGRRASMKPSMLSGGMSADTSLGNITEERTRLQAEEDLAKRQGSTQRLKQKRSSITAETGQLDDKPSFSNIKELAQVQKDVRRSSIADFRMQSGFGSRATHFTPIVVSDDKPNITRAASSPTMDNAKAKARAALKAKLDLKIPKKGNKPPPEMLNDLENDALKYPAVTPREIEKVMTRRHSTTCSNSPGSRRKLSNASLPSPHSRRKLSNISLPSELLSRSRKLSTTSNSPGVDSVPSRKMSSASTLSDGAFCEESHSPHIEVDQNSDGGTKLSENSNDKGGDATKTDGPISRSQNEILEQRLPKAETGHSEVQQPSPVCLSDSLQTKVHTITHSPITSDNSFSPIKLPENTEVQHALPPAQPQTESSTSLTQKEQSTKADNGIPQTNEPVVGVPTGTQSNATVPSLNVSMENGQPNNHVNPPGGAAGNVTQAAVVSPISHVAQNVQSVGQISPVPIGQVIGQSNPPQVMGQMSPSQNIQVMGQMSPAQFVSQPNMYHPSAVSGHMMTQGVVPGSSSPLVPLSIPTGQVFNPAMMPTFPYQVQLQADPQTGLYRMVPVGLPIQGVPFHSSNGSLSGNSFGSPASNPSTPPQNMSTPPELTLPNPNNLHSYWTRQKGILDTSSDGDSTCIPLSPESLRRVVVDRKRDQVKKKTEKSKYGTPPSKRSNAKTASSSLIRNPTDSESSESYALSKPKDTKKPSPQIVKKKHAKGSHSDGDRKERIKERVRERSDKSKREDSTYSRSRSCDRLNGSPQVHKRGVLSRSDASGKSQEELPIAEIKQKQNTKSRYATDDVDDSRPMELSLATASPASVSSVSRDSGVNMRFSMSSGEDMSQVTESQLADALQGHNVVRRVMKLIRHAFAFDGYMENGVEDKEMAEYIKSLAKLSWMTFSSAVTEKFCDLYWEEDLLEMLYETVNGEKPNKPQQTQHRPVIVHPKRTKPHSKPSSSSSSKTHATKTKPQKAKPASSSKHPEEDDVLSDLLPDDAFTTSTPARHSRSTVKSNVVADAKSFANEKKASSDANRARSGSDKMRSTSRDKLRNTSRDRSKTRAESHSREVTPRKEEKTLIEKSDGESSGGKKTAPPKPKRNPSPGIEPVAKPRNKKHDGKGGEPKAPPRHRTRSREEAKIESSQDNVKKQTKQARGVKDEAKTTTQTDNSSHSNQDLFLTGLPAINEPSNVANSNRVAKSKSKESLPNGVRKTQSKESLSSSWSDSQFNSTNKSKSRDSLDLNQSQTSIASSQSSGPYFGNKSLNQSTSSYEAPMSNIRTRPSGTKALNSSSQHNWQLPNSDSSDSNSPAVKERISSLLQNALSRRDSMLSVSSTSSSGTSHFLKTSGDDSMLSLPGSFSDDGRPGLPNGMVYRSDGGVDPRIAAYTQQLTGAGETQNSIETKIADVEQQLMMERRMKNKTEKFYQKLIDAQQTKGADHKTMLAKVGKQLTEMTTKIEFLESAKRHLEMLYAEQWGLDFNLLYSFATSMGTEPLHLKPSEDNPLLSFHLSRNKQSLQAGEPLGLFSFLFARQALLVGFLHHFFYTYHYFATSEELFQFIREKFCAATGMYQSDQQENRSKILCRAVDILQVWVEGFYEVDFRPNPKLLEQLIIFTTEKLIPVDPQGQSLLQMLDKYQREKATMGGWPTVSRKLSSASQKSSPVKESTSFSSPTRLRHQDSSRLKMGIMACFTKKDSSKQDSEPTYLPASSMDKEGFSLSEHTSLTLAQQLTLMQQDLFQKIHPVHYLNSRCKGIGVSTNNNSATTTQNSLHNGTAENGILAGELSTSLFVESLIEDGKIKVLLDHARGISHWVSAEIVTCSSSKAQMALLSKFINTAKACYETRNFATCVQIMDGLENLIVRQVPAWRSLPSKVVSIYEDLSSARVLLQADSDSLVKGEAHHNQPTLPPTLLFLMHVQQLEIGGFQLANGLFKWPKIKSIAKLIDNIRLFQDNLYPFDADTTLQDLLKQRVAEFHNDDIQVLAARNSSNFHQLSSSKGGGKRLQNAFQRVKANLQH